MANGTVEGTSGNDLMLGGFVDADNDTIDGADGVDDIIVAGAGDDIVLAGDGNDEIYGGDGYDQLKGEAGDDVIDGGAGPNDLYGDAGDDILVGGEGADTLYGGTGQDNVDYSNSAAGVNINLTTGVISGGDADNDTIAEGVEGVIGSDFDDVMVGFDHQGTTAGDIYTNEFYGGGGNDSISAMDGDDVLEGGTGADTLDGGLGADLIDGGDDRDLIFGDAGDDIDGGAGGDDFDTLDLRGLGSVNIINTVPDSNGNGFNGTVEFLDASGAVTGTLDFVEIEEILTDDGNQSPIANNDIATTSEDDSVVIDVLSNDTDPDSDPLEVLGTPTALHGTVVVNGDDTLTYTPDAGYFGADTITYQITDGNGGVDTGEVAVTVTEDTPGLDGTVSGTAGDDLIDTAYAGDPDGDMIDAGDAVVPGEAPDDDIVEAGAGDDTVLAGLGDDSIIGEAGNDVLAGGVGDDEISGGDGDDTIVLEDGFGNDVITGGETGETVGDVLDATAVTDDTTVVLSDPETGTITDGTDTANFAEIEALELGSGDDDVTGSTGDDTVDLGEGEDVVNAGEGDDTIGLGQDPDGTPDGDADLIVFSDGDGSDTILDFDAPFADLITGAPVGIDMLDVSGMTDVAGDPVDTDDVIVTDDGAGNALLTFPNGESLTLMGVDPTEVDSPEELNAIGIPLPGVTGLDGTVSGSAGADLIDAAYTGDPDGDMVDAGDAVVPGAAPDDDIIEAGAGDDVVFAGVGDDDIFGGSGNDEIFAGEGDDMIDGGLGDDVITGGDGSDSVLGGDGNDSIDTSGPTGPLEGLPDRGYPGLYPGDADPTNDMDTVDGGDGNDNITTGDDNDSIMGGAGDDTIDGGWDDDSIDGGTGNDYIVGGEGQDNIDGGDGDDTIYGGLDGGAPDALNLPDAIDLRPDNGLDTIHGGAGNDIIDGGEGSDQMFGEDGRDTFVVSSPLDGNGDHADGGSGGDDFDVLDLSAAGAFRVVGETVDADGNSTSGTIEFLDGASGIVTGSMTFTEIEDIIPCFTPGTLIATMRGEKRVEELKVGDRIITRDNGAQEIRWIGSKQVSGAELAAKPHLQPILICQGALGKGLPERDLLVSPNHRVLVNNSDVELYFNQSEVLVPAKHLVESGVGIQTICETGTTYIHVMFDNHEVILSDGAWTESFQPGDLTLNGIADTQRAEIFELFPELEQQEGREGYAAARQSLKKHEARLLFK